MIRRASFGVAPDGREVEAVTLALPDGAAARILSFGATLQNLLTPDREGRLDDVVLGHDSAAEYAQRRNYLGASVGRFANRIDGGSFVMEGVRYAIPPNDGAHALHGGPQGFDLRHWEIEDIAEGGHPAVALTLESPAGDQGFPGNLRVRATYSLEPRPGGAALRIRYEATTDKPTPVNLTHHAYFNLGGGLKEPTKIRSATDHDLAIFADRYSPVDEGLIPEGDPQPVEGTPFDFRKPRRIGALLRQDHPQILRARGYDHNFCLNGHDPQAKASRLAAKLSDPVSGRSMEIWSDQPGIQFYSGNFLDGTLRGKGGVLYRMGDGLCLEPQAWPNSPNRPDFPPCLLAPGETYLHDMELRFSALAG